MLLDKYDIQLDDALAKILDEESDDSEEIMSTLLYASYLIRCTGRLKPIELWCGKYQEKRRGEGDVMERRIPFLPSYKSEEEISHFTEFIIKTCTDSCGSAVRMTPWTAQGDTSNLHKDLKNPILFARSALAVATRSLPVVSPKLVSIARQVASGEKSKRETTLHLVRKEIYESNLRKDSVITFEFKANQVCFMILW